VVERVRTWHNNLRGKIGNKDCPRRILACEALACKPSVEVTTGRLKSIADSLDLLLASRKGFLDFVKTHWDRVLHAAFFFPNSTARSRLPTFHRSCSTRRQREGKEIARATITRLKDYLQEGTYDN
jgi:hypothetical protein